MSASVPLTKPRPTSARPTSPTTSRQSTKPNLKVVAPPRPNVAGTGMFSLVIVGILVTGMVILLFLNTTLAQGAFQMHELTKAQQALNIAKQQLTQSVEVAQSPEQLQARATALGMVPSDNPVFIRLADGKVLGTPIPAPRPPKAVKAVPAIALSVNGSSTSTASNLKVSTGTTAVKVP